MFRKKFSQLGQVVDIFCLGKLDKEGKPFGFVRFPAKYDELKLLDDLNNVWVDSYKLRAFFPKIQRKERDSTQKIELTNREQKDREVRYHSFKVGSGIRDPYKSYLGTLVGKKEELDMHINVTDSISQNMSKMEEAEWLKESYTCLLKVQFPWEDVKEELKSECDIAIGLTYMGDDVVLV